jgi:hypothetical protein
MRITYTPTINPMEHSINKTFKKWQRVADYSITQQTRNFLE